MNLNFFRSKRFLWILLGLTALGVTTGYTFFRRDAKAEDYLTGKTERGNIKNTVSATGTLQAVTTVQVGSQVSGTISALFADFNSVVRKGQIVAQLDPALFQAQVSQQRANVEQARANLSNAKARVQVAEADVSTQRSGVSGAAANLAALKAQRDDAAKLLERQESLAQSGVIAERDLDSARTAFRAADARYNQAMTQLDQAKTGEHTAANAGLAQAKSQVQQAQAQVQQAEAALKLAEVNLSHTTIASPIDGVVVSRNVDVGQTVAASLSAPTLFTIANDLTQMQVIANIDQADIGVINDNNKVNFTVDAFPGTTFQGSINQIRLNPQNVQNVVTYNVVIDVKNPDLKLKPGMTANLTFTIAERNNALKIPNAALRFRPQDVTPEKIREMLRASSGNEQPQAKRQDDKQSTDASSHARSNNKPTGNKPADRSTDRPKDSKDGKNSEDAGDRAKRFGKDRQADTKQGEATGEKSESAGQTRRRNGDRQSSDQGSKRQGQNQGDGAAKNAGNMPKEEGQRFGGFAQGPTTVEPQWRIIWVLGSDKKPQPRRVQIGITDGVTTEILQGDLKEGDQVIVGQNISSDSRTTTRTSGPGFGGTNVPGGRGGGIGGGGGGGGVRR